MAEDRAILEQIGRLKQEMAIAEARAAQKAKKKKKPTLETATEGLVSGIENSLKDPQMDDEQTSMRIPVTTYVQYLKDIHAAKKAGKIFARTDKRR